MGTDVETIPANGLWRKGDELSRLLLDVAAGRAVSPFQPLPPESLQLVQQHGLVGLMVHSENVSLREAALPAFVRWSARQEVMKKHLRRLLVSFSEADIQVAVLKGPYLGEFVYQNPRQRMFTDIDLLVPRASLERALDVLRADPVVASIPKKKPKADKREIPLVDRATRILFNLDMHWDLFSYTQLQGSADGATDEAWAAAGQPVETTLGPMCHLPAAARLAFLCTHALLDHRFRLALFRDLAEEACRPVEWEELVGFADRWGLRSTTYLSLLIAARAVDAPVPAGVLAELRPSNALVRAIESILPRTDLVRFDGHRPHPLNLAVVLLHDDFMKRAALVARAPAAFPDWKRRVALTTPNGGTATAASGGRSVAVLVTTDRRRGAEVFGERLTEALEDRGWDATLLALTHDAKGPRIDARVVSGSTPEQLG